VLIIFGISRKVARLATVFALCAFCHTPAAQVVTRVRSYFALFFIPIIPLGTKHRTTCTLCGNTSEISAEEGEQAVQAAAQHQAATPPGAPGAVGSPGWAPPAPSPLPAPTLQPPTMPTAPGPGPQPG